MNSLGIDSPTKVVTVLVTGGSGFLAMYCIWELARRGYSIRTTLRSPEREGEVRKMLYRGGLDKNYPLSFLKADPNSDDGWREALDHCRYVVHVAFPSPERKVSGGDEEAQAAREGTLRILRLAKERGIKRVVLTSSFATIGYGTNTRKLFTEQDWTVLTDKTDPYIRMKTLTEKAAWDFVAVEKSPELTVINPTHLFGPVCRTDYSPSIDLLKSMLEGSTFRVPKVGFSIVDVRDGAVLHLLAMEEPAVAGQRFIATSGEFLSMLQIAQILKKNMKQFSPQIPSQKMPNWLVRLTSVFFPEIRSILPNLSVVRQASNEKARSIFSWEPLPVKKTIIDTAQSLVEQGIVTARGLH